MWKAASTTSPEISFGSRGAEPIFLRPLRGTRSRLCSRQWHPPSGLGDLFHGITEWHNYLKLLSINSIGARADGIDRARKLDLSVLSILFRGNLIRTALGVLDRFTLSCVMDYLGQRIRFCTAHDGTRIAYAMTGEGPPLVKAANWLSHLEFDWNSPVWRHWLTELSKYNTLIRYDERGNGLSDREVDDLSFEAWVADLESVVDARGLDRFPILGISQGGAVAVAYAVRHPERVSALILYGAYARGWNHREKTPQQ